MARHDSRRALHLDDKAFQHKAFQDNARIRLTVRNFTTMSHAWSCTCGQLVDGVDMAHALGCRSPNSLLIALQDETADAMRKYVGHLGFSSNRESPYQGLRTTDCARAHWDFHCHIWPGPGHILGDPSSTFAPSSVHRIAPPGKPVAQPEAGTRKSCMNTSGTTTGPLFPPHLL
jgi:hypothetical protein